MLMGLLASNGLSVEALLCMSQEQQRVSLVSMHEYIQYMLCADICMYFRITGSFVSGDCN